VDNFTLWVIYPVETAPAIHETGGWVVPKVDLDVTAYSRSPGPWWE